MKDKHNMGNWIRPKLMIMTLGGSPEPLIRSIEEMNPERIVFLASHDSISLAGTILGSIGYKPAVEYVITENPNLMHECYKAARNCIDRVKYRDIRSEEVLVDYTGGTKVMSAALILASAGRRYRFNYVGGDRRNKDGLGTVVAGFEKMFPEMSPWAIFAEEERRQVVTLFNRRRFSAVMEIINHASERELPIQIRDYFRFIKEMADVFLLWDQFQHKDAIKFFDKGLTYLSDYLHAYPDSDLERFKNRVQECNKYLERLIDLTDGMKTSHMILITDLLNNARRKIADKRYDDAAARIYRALELYGQILFRETTGCENSRVKPDIIPENLRKDFERRYIDVDSGRLKLPLSATFDYLEAVGHEAGKRFVEKKDKIKNIQSNRNKSILAHGINPVTEKAIQSIFNTVSDFVQVNDFFDFPELP